VATYSLDSGRGGASTHFAVNNNNVFKQKPKYLYLEMRYFLEKSCKIAAALGTSPQSLNHRYLGLCRRHSFTGP